MMMTSKQDEMIKKVVEDIKGTKVLMSMFHVCNRVAIIPELASLPFSDVWERISYHRGALNDRMDFAERSYLE